MTVLPSDLDIQLAFLRSQLTDLHTCMPAEVVAVRDGKDARQFVDVLPLLQRSVIDADGEPLDEPYPVIPMVPVGYVQGGGFFLSLPLRVGDVVLLVFAERSLDAWIESARAGKQSPIVPGDLSMHTLQGAVALPCGPAPRSGLLQGVDAADLVIGKSDGTILLRLTAAGQAVLVEGTQFVALANLVLDRLNTIQTTFDGHTHPAVTTATVGLAGPATVTVSTPGSTIGALASVAATKTKAT